MDGMWRSAIKPSEPGEVHCMRCHLPFLSPDKIRIKTCPKCKRDTERCGKLADHMATCHDVPLPDPPITREDLR